MMATPVPRGDANLADPAEMLRAAELELALGRAQRQPTGGSRRVFLRLFSVLLLLGLLAAGLGAMWYLQTVAAQRGITPAAHAR